MWSSQFLSPPLSSSSFQSLPLSSRPLLWHLRNAENKKRFSRSCRAPMASLHNQVAPQNIDSCKRRALLILGISVFPLLPLKNEVFASEVEERNGNEKQNIEQGGSSSNPFLSLLNALGLLSSGVLAALYSLAQKEQSTSEATIESDNAIVSLERSFESKLLQQKEEQNKLLNKAKEEQLSLANRLESANSTITGLGRELQGEKQKIDQLQAHIGDLRLKLEKAEKEKDSLEENVKEKDSSIAALQGRVNLLSSEVKDKEETIQGLSSSLAQKDSDLTKLNTSYQQTRVEVDTLKSEIVNLNEELSKHRNELEQKNSMLEDLNVSVDSLKVERDDLKQKLNTLEHEFEGLRSSSEKKAADDRKLLEDRENELRQLKETYELSLKEADAKQAVISDLTKDRDALKKTLDMEAENMQSMKQELQLTKEALESSKQEASDLTMELSESRKSSSELEAELLKVQTEFSEEKESFQNSLNEAIKSLDEMKQQALTLSKDLEVSNSRISSLEEEREFLVNSLEKEKKLARDAQENLEDAQSVMARLGTERESFQKRAKKLEDDLASAKGEFLHLRAQANKQEREPVVNSESEEETDTQNGVNNGNTQLEQEGEAAVKTTAAPAKKTTRKKRASSR
ncbi:MAR-binding filament-like protein 1-1 [Bienertia sinuspersici]